VNPYRLAFSRGHWYLDGWDHDRADDRQFRLDRMTGEVTVGEAGSFERPDAIEPRSAEPWELGDEPPVTARVRIDGDQAGWALDHLGNAEVIETAPDGAVVVELNVTNLDAFRSFVLGFLDHAEVLAPEELRTELIDWLTDAARLG
jgi:predicted DNA-binding transcriptional regulator YafY